jgi:biotin carboxyl carrier protein
VDIDGRVRIVAIREDGEGLTASVDGRAFRVDLADAGSHWSLLLSPAGRWAGAASSYEIGLHDDPGDAPTVFVNGRAVRAAVEDPRDAPRRTPRPTADAEAGGADRILAPMPGRVVKVLVKPGDRVSARQGLVVVEAMKMENELRAVRAGRVAEVRVTEGTLVEARAVLLVLHAGADER